MSVSSANVDGMPPTTLPSEEVERVLAHVGGIEATATAPSLIARDAQYADIKSTSNGNPEEVRLCYDVAGDSKNPAVLLVMGLGTTMVAWLPVFVESLVKKGYFVIRMDNRDIGLSSRLNHLALPNIPATFVKNLLWFTRKRQENTGAYTLDDMGNDCFQLLDHLKIANAHVVGASMGGMIAQCMALAHPERVMSLTSIMSTTGAHDLPGAEMRMIRYFVKTPAKTPAEQNDRSVEFFQAAGSKEHFDAQATRLLSEWAVDRAEDRSGVPRQLHAVLTAPPRDAALKKLRNVPTLIIHGAQDPLLRPACGERTHACIHDSEWLLIPEMGHDMPLPCVPTITEGIHRNAGRCTKQRGFICGDETASGAATDNAVSDDAPDRQ